jgi:hemolysin-activating ACP:hemolysin acyltransferase
MERSEIRDYACGMRSHIPPRSMRASGWVVEATAPFGGAEEMVKDLNAKVFAERPVKFLSVGARGREVKTL